MSDRNPAALSRENLRPASTSEDFDLASGERWYVVQALVNREVSAQVQLRRQAFRVFLPIIEKTVRHARKTHIAKVAAFPGYLFMILDINRDRWLSVNGTIGVARLVMGRTAPLPAPCGVVEALLDYRDQTGVCRFDRELLVGQKVRVVAGPFAKMIGRLDRLDGAGRVRILVEMLGGVAPAIVDRSAIEAA